MTAPLRWVLALAAIGALGFAAGRYLGREGASSPYPLSFPDFVAGGSAPAGSTSAPASASGNRPDPQRAPASVHEIMNLPSDFAQTASLYVLAANSDQQGIERLLDEAATIQRGSERRSATNILYERYAELDPQAAVEHYMSRQSEQYPNWLYAMFYGWARTDLNGAIARAATLDDENRQAAGTAIVRSRDDLSRSERASMASQLDVQASMRESSNPDLSSPQAVERAWQGSLAIADRKARHYEQYTIVNAWARKDPHAAIRAIESVQNRSERDHLSQYLVQAWAQKAPRDAVAWVLERPPSYQRSQLLSSALSSMVTKEPSATMTMVERLPKVEQQQVLHEVLLRWASVDAPSAAEWAMKMDGERENRHILSMVVMNYAQQDLDEAFQWAAALPGEHGQDVLRQLVQYVAQYDPERASDMIGQMDEGPGRGEAISSVAQGLAASDPRAALTWIAKQPSSDVTPDAYTSVFGTWAPYDLDGAVSQLNFMMETEHRNAAIQGIVQSVPLDQAMLDQLFQRIEGAEAKSTAASHVYYLLMDRDPQRAERYRIMAGLPPEPGGVN